MATTMMCRLAVHAPLTLWPTRSYISGEIGAEFRSRSDDGRPTDDLIGLAQEIVPYNMRHNAETEACDLLMELERLDLLIDHVDRDAYQRVCLYLVSTVPYVTEPEDAQLLRCAMDIYCKFQRYPEALEAAMRLDSMNDINRVFNMTSDAYVVAGRHRGRGGPACR